MINQAREDFCQGRFPASLIYWADRESMARCAVDFYYCAASLSCLSFTITLRQLNVIYVTCYTTPLLSISNALLILARHNERDVAWLLQLQPTLQPTKPKGFFTRNYLRGKILIRSPDQAQLSGVVFAKITIQILIPP